MKVCPTCGEVYPEQASECRVHGAGLREWAESGETFTGDSTDVDESRPGALLVRVDTEVDEGTATDLGRPAGLREPTEPTPLVQVAPEALIPVASPWEGRTLGGRYRLERKIGIGGYGAVFGAFDERLRKRVAIKILSPALSQDPEVLERFRREAVAASQIRHPGIVDVTDIDVDAGGTHFIAMEYLDGLDLDEVLGTERTVEATRALAIAAQCADALAGAHAAGILHRDLKPANIFLTRDERREDVVKIIDFGISKITHQIEFSQDLTSASKVVGTPSYMSPEQARGEQLDGRADVYGLGIILYEMLTGTVPFKGKSALEILTNHATATRVAPSEVNVALNRHPALDALVLRAIAADRNRRFASMEEFGDAVRETLAMLGGAPTSALSDGSGPSRSADGPALAGRWLASEPREPLSSEVTRLHRAGPRRARGLLYGGLMLGLVALVALVWVARKGSSPTRRSGPGSAPTRADRSQTSLDAGAEEDTPSTLDAEPSVADKSKVAGETKARPRETGKTKSAPRAAVKRQVERDSRKSNVHGSRKAGRDKEGAIGIEEW